MLRLESLGAPLSLLQVWGPALLRQLYERDGRRTFCPSALWLAPFNSQFNSSGSNGDAGIIPYHEKLLDMLHKHGLQTLLSQADRT